MKISAAAMTITPRMRSPILLTGDARGDHTLTGLEKCGAMKKGGTMKIDILKLPHHGSDRDVDHDYFERIIADHYVISANGKYSNPDIPSKGDDDFTIHFTYALDDFSDQKVAKEIKTFLAKEKKKGRKYETAFGNVRIAL